MRAMANWERKSSYLVVEVIKFQTYVDCLTAALTHREEIYREREAYKIKPPPSSRPGNSAHADDDGTESATSAAAINDII
jgi:hypothetical protein